MLTDRAPMDYRYLSRRLVREIVQSDRSNPRPPKTRAWRIGVGGVSAEFRESEPDYENPFELAERAAIAVRDYTGGLDAGGEYLRCELEFAVGFVPVFSGWEDETHVKVACVFAEEPVADIGTVFVGLFGSKTNLVGWREPDDVVGWIPSDGRGIYEILSRSHEPEDPALDRSYVAEEAELNLVDLLDEARTTAKGLRAPCFETLDVLARVHGRATDVELGNVHYDLAIIGAPIWARTPAPRSLLGN